MLHVAWLPGLLACAHLGCDRGSRTEPTAERATTNEPDQIGTIEQENRKTASGGTGSSSGTATSATVTQPPVADAGVAAPACLASNVLSKLGGTGRLLVGASMSDDAANQAAWDMRYLYLAGGLQDGASACQSCGSCTANGVSCSNTGGGCQWWGCWQDDQVPPGDYLRAFINKAESAHQLPVLTYYEFLDVSGLGEGSGQLAAAQDVSKMQRYLNDWRFTLQQVGNHRVLLHLEPDLWGYAQGVNENPSAIPAAVASANPQDCGSMENSVAGLGRCMVSMARKYAPNALVGLHASSWATGTDAMQNRDAATDVNALAQRTADFLLNAGGRESDFIALELSDRDAGWYELQGQQRWFDATNATLPNFTQAFTWAKTLTARMQKPALWWQLPVGNMSLPNTFQQYKDNRVDYLMSHLNEVAQTNAFGVLFGAGLSHQTNPSTDNGNLVSKMKAYAGTAGQPACSP